MQRQGPAPPPLRLDAGAERAEDSGANWHHS